MAYTLNFYNSGKLKTLDGTLRWGEIANVAAVLLTDSYTPDKRSHATYVDIKANEVDPAVQTDYAPVAVTGRTVEAVEIADDEVEVRYDCAIIDYGSLVTLASRYVGIVAGDATSLADGDDLIGYIDFGETKSSTNNNYKISPAETGLFRVDTTV